MLPNTSEEINFQLYVDLVKQNKLHWNIFINVMQDISYSDINRLKILNAILLSELTINFSDLDKMKYLNSILLIQFKNHIQIDENFEVIQNEDGEKSVESNAPEEPYDEYKDNLTSLVKDEIMEIYPSDTNSQTDESNFHEEIADESKDDLLGEEVNEIISSETNEKTFPCHICDKEYNIYFQLKQHISKVHEEKKSRNFHVNINNDRKLDEHETTNKNVTLISNANILKEHVQVIQVDHKDHKCNFCDKLFSQKRRLKMHIGLVHKDDKDSKCKSCNKSFFNTNSLKRHIHTVHEGHKDYKCDYCGKSFSDGGTLRKHIHIVH